MQEDGDTRGAIPQGSERGSAGRPSVRPRHCWEIVRQVPGLHYNCEECYAYFVQQDCWTLWALRRPGFKPCCQKKADCTECVVLNERMRPRVDETMEIQRQHPVRPAPGAAKRICSYLQIYSGGESLEGENRTTAISRSLQMRNTDFRCRLRGVHLDMGYVNDVCVSRHVEECVFLDESRPGIMLRPLPVINQIQRAPEAKQGGEEDAPKLPDGGIVESQVSAPLPDGITHDR